MSKLNETNITKKDMESLKSVSDNIAQNSTVMDDLKKVKANLGDAKIERSMITSDDFDPTDPSKMVGNVPVLLDVIRDVSGNTQTPMVGMLESKGSLDADSFMFEMMSEALDTAAAENYKVAEGGIAYSPDHNYARKQNKVMIMGVSISLSDLGKGVAKLPNSENLISTKFRNNLRCLQMAKEHYMFNGDMAKNNETDGILTIIDKAIIAGDAATSKTYSGGGSALDQDDLENMLMSAISDNGADASALKLWVCKKAFATIGDWYRTDIRFTVKGEGPFATFTGSPNSPIYPSKMGWEFPMLFFNEAKTSNVNDVVLLLDHNELSLVRLLPPRLQPVPLQGAFTSYHEMFLETIGLNFLYTLSSGKIDNITA